MNYSISQRSSGWREEGIFIKFLFYLGIKNRRGCKISHAYIFWAKYGEDLAYGPEGWKINQIFSKHKAWPSSKQRLSFYYSLFT